MYKNESRSDEILPVRGHDLRYRVPPWEEAKGVKMTSDMETADSDENPTDLERVVWKTADRIASEITNAEALAKRDQSR
jgi:hypothetical protein